MDAATIRARRDRLVAEHGPWVGYNTQLADGVYTMSDGQVGTAEFMVSGMVQVVADLSDKPPEQLRILDLGSHEGGYAIEFGLHGATVVGVEGRVENIEKARFVAEVLGLDRVSFVEGDVRELDVEQLGTFDVVLCLGILYHLEAPDAVRLIERCGELSTRMTVVRSAIGLSVDATVTVDGHDYAGRTYAEDIRERGASLDNPTSVLPTRASLLNLLSGAGFSSVVEVCSPTVPALQRVLDSVTFVAMRGPRLPFRSVPELEPVLAQVRHPQRPRGPAWIWAVAHPQQSLYWRLNERLLHRFSRAIFQSRRPSDGWRE